MSPEQLKDFIELYPHTSNYTLADRFGIARSSVQRLGRKHNLEKAHTYLENLAANRSIAIKMLVRHKATPEPEDLGDYCPRRLVIEEISYLIDNGYKPRLAENVRARLGFLWKQPPTWFAERMGWPLELWIERLATLPKGKL